MTTESIKSIVDELVKYYQDDTTFDIYNMVRKSIRQLFQDKKRTEALDYLESLHL